MGFEKTHLTAATPAVTNQLVTTTNMIVGAYAVANAGAMPTPGARHITLVRTVAGNADTPGTVTITGKDLNGAAISEALVVGATGVTVTGLLWFASVNSDGITGAGWVIDAGTSTNDTIIVGCAAGCIVAQGSGTLHGIVVNTTAAGTVTLSDSSGTFAILKSSVAEGYFLYDVNYYGYLSVALGANSDVTLIRTGNLPTSYALA